MKILIINFEYPPLGGGGGVATKQIAEALAHRHEVHVLTTGFHSLPRFEMIGGVRIHRVPVIGRRSLPTASLVSMFTFIPAALMAGIRLYTSHSFDVLNAQFVVPSGIPAALLAKLYRIPFVLSFIGGDVFDPTKGISPHRHWLFRWIIRAVTRTADACTAISEDTKQRALQLHKVQHAITVTHLGLAPRTSSPATRASLGLPEHVPLFVSVGRLIPRKGYDVLLAAWREIPTAHLAIIGDGPLMEKLKRVRDSWQLEGRVHLLGFVEEERKHQILCVADAYVSATEHEGFGIVFLEAMYAGLPIVATDRGGHTDFLTEGENAILVPPHDARQLAAAIVWLLRDSRLRETMAAKNREKVEDFYLEKTVKRFEKVLVDAAKRRLQ